MSFRVVRPLLVLATVSSVAWSCTATETNVFRSSCELHPDADANAGECDAGAHEGDAGPEAEPCTTDADCPESRPVCGDGDLCRPKQT